jgi:hypothetical protein
MAFAFALALVLFAAAGGWAASSEPPNPGQGRSAPDIALPGYLAPQVDPATGLTTVRVTDPGGTEPGDRFCHKSYCTHRYSSSQAWNADQSLLLIANGCGGLCFLDGQTYAPLFRRQRRGECEWHPKNPDLMICVAGRSISLWAPRTNHDDVIYTAKHYRELRFGPSKGNPSLDGNRIVVRGVAADGALDAFAFDIPTRRPLPAIHLASLPGVNSYCSISPLGDYIVCIQEQPPADIENTYIFAVGGDLVQTWPEHHRPGHGDMTVNDAGDEVYVGISKSEPDLYQVIERRLRDGVVTSLAPYGEGQHVSLRALTRPQWAYVSYAGYPDEVASHPDWAPFAQAVVAFRLDGDGAPRLIARTRNAPHDYWSETHASPSPDGSQVIWSSNWGNPGGPVFDFVTRLTPKGAKQDITIKDDASGR